MRDTTRRAPLWLSSGPHVGGHVFLGLIGKGFALMAFLIAPVFLVIGVLHLFSEPLNQIFAQWLHVTLPVTGLVIPVVLLALGVVLLQKSRKGS